MILCNLNTLKSICSSSHFQHSSHYNRKQLGHRVNTLRAKTLEYISEDLPAVHFIDKYSMLRNWLGEVFKVEQATQRANLSAKQYKLEANDESRDMYWKQALSFITFHGSNNTWKTAAFEVVVNHKTGQSGPCVLLHKVDRSDCVTLAVAMVNDDNYNYGEIPSNIIPINGEYHLRDGPSVLWCSPNGVAMLSVNDTNKMTLNCFSPDQLFDIDNTGGLECMLDKIWVLSERQELSSLTIFVRASLSASGDLNPAKKIKSLEPDILWSTAVIKEQDSSPTVTKLSKNLYIHSDYAPVINCITAYDNSGPYTLGDPNRSTHYIAGTTYQQMLIFENGKVLHHTSLECVPVTILFCQLGASDAFIVQDGIDSVFVYTLIKTGFVLQRSWTGVFAVLIDDFVLNGNEQLLMIMDDPTSDDFSLSNFVLTDLEMIEIPSSQNDVVEDENRRSNDETMNSAVTALQKRLMHEEKVLDELRTEHQQKKQLLHKASKFLTCLDKGVAYNATSDQSLVPLLEPIGDQDEPPASQSATSDIGTLDVVNTWQRIMDSQWIVGIVVVNNTRSPITKVAGTIACTAHTEIKETKCVMFPDQPVEGGPLPVMGLTDSQLGHSQAANLVCVTELPVFTSDKLQAGILLCWKDVESGTAKTRYAEHVQLRAEEVYNTSLCCKPVSDWCNPINEHVSQDRMAYLITHQIIELEFKSLFTDLRKLPHMLTTSLPLSNHVVISADAATPTIAPMSPTHTSTAVVIIPTIMEKKYASSIVLYKEKSRFSVLLQLFRGSLASDIDVQPVEYGWRETIRRCHQRLQRHVEHLISLTDEQLRTGRKLTEYDFYDHKVDLDMKSVLELIENTTL